jgi:hypothetical protein
MFPMQEACAMQDVFGFAALANTNTGTMYTNLTGAFLVQSFKNMQYIFVAYIYNLNAIVIRPMPSQTNASFIAAITKIVTVLRAPDYQLSLNVMDNECSKALKKHIHANKMNIQLVPPHNHRVNAAERAIATFKDHFVATLATVNMLCPLQLWDKFLPQVELTLNFLRFSRCNPSILANTELYGAFNFNKTPFAPLGTKALIFDDPATRTSWAPHATDCFFVGPANDQNRSLYFYIPITRRFRFSDTWRLYPAHCSVPILSEHDQMLRAAANLLKQLGLTIPASATAKIKHLAAIRKLTKIMGKYTPAPLPSAAPPRVGTATPPRVVVAAPLRVPTSLNNITAPHNVRGLPIVHQCHMRNNNPFQALADNKDDDDEDTVMASNCSPPL